MAFKALCGLLRPHFSLSFSPAWHTAYFQIPKCHLSFSAPVPLHESLLPEIFSSSLFVRSQLKGCFGQESSVLISQQVLSIHCFVESPTFMSVFPTDWVCSLLRPLLLPDTQTGTSKNVLAEFISPSPYLHHPIFFKRGQSFLPSLSPVITARVHPFLFNSGPLQ